MGQQNVAAIWLNFAKHQTKSPLSFGVPATLFSGDMMRLLCAVATTMNPN